jgi:hypothetical protein
MQRVERLGAGPSGWAPSLTQLQAGQDAFAGLVTDGGWWGHEVLIPVYRPVAGTWWQRLSGRVRRKSEPPTPVAALSLTADYWQVDSQAPGGSGAPDGIFDSLESLYEFLSGMTIDWYPPTRAVLAVDRMRTGPLDDSG